MHGRTARKGFLTTVNGANNELSVCGHTDHGTRMTIGIIRTACVCRDVLTVPNKGTAENIDSFADTGFLTTVPSFLSIIYHSRAVVQNSQERRVTVLVPILFHIAAHNKHAARFTRCHVIAVAVTSGYDIVVLAYILRIFRIRIFFIRTSHHVGELFHAVDLILHISVCDLSHDIITT